jgi:peptide/nickel transport system ATP-binding protein/oligopeptide transport system ATP-binding protein
MENLLEVRNLSVAFMRNGKSAKVVDAVNFDVKPGEILGMVGESGSGKSVTAKSIMRLIPDPPGKIVSGEVFFEGKDILAMNKKELLDIRGNKISMIFQEPMTSLNPVYTCGNQIMEAIILHQKVNKKQARGKAIEMLRRVGISMPEKRIDNYPHELSGGMRQRVMIAMALSCNPSLLIADEPTTALDPTIQAQIIRLIKNLRDGFGISVLYITHDLGVVAELCNRVLVMYASQILEIAPVRELFRNPKNPYTQGLLKAIPKLDERRDSLYNIPGTVPDFTALPSGCYFHPRCPFQADLCGNKAPSLFQCGENHYSRCWLCRESGGRAKEN